MWGLDAALPFFRWLSSRQEFKLDTTGSFMRVVYSHESSVWARTDSHTHGDLRVRSGRRQRTGGAGKQLFRRALIVAKCRSRSSCHRAGYDSKLRALAKVELGFDPRNLVTLQIQLPEKSYPTDAARSRFGRVPRRRGQSARRQVGDAHREALARHRAVYNGFTSSVARRRRTTPECRQLAFAGDDFFSTSGDRNRQRARLYPGSQRNGGRPSCSQ